MVYDGLELMIGLNGAMDPRNGGICRDKGGQDD